VGADGWHSVALTLTGTAGFAQAFEREFDLAGE